LISASPDADELPAVAYPLLGRPELGRFATVGCAASLWLFCFFASGRA